jgi:hypothetical protein
LLLLLLLLRLLLLVRLLLLLLLLLHLWLPLPPLSLAHRPLRPLQQRARARGLAPRVRVS